MKKAIILIVALFMAGLLAPVATVAQNQAILNRLKSRYSLTRYYPECGGWYLLGYSDRGVNYYGFADKEGNVIATNAVKYKIHKGFIELQVFDEMKKNEHDQWLMDKKQYDRDYQAYIREEKRYESELKAYNERVAAAKNEAHNQWVAARQRAYEAAVAEYRRKNPSSSSSNSSFLGSLLTGLAEGISDATIGQSAADQVAYQPFEDRILGERGLTTAPYKVHNPAPEMPKEPSNGYEWQNYTFRQPCPYTEIDYSAISDDKGVAVVKADGVYGLVDASLNTVLPCKYSSVIRFGNKFRIEDGGLYGLVDSRGKTIVPCEFTKIDYNNGCLVAKKGKLWGLYTEDFEELYSCQYSDLKFSSIDGRQILHAQLKGLWGAYDFGSGEQILPFSYGKIENMKFGKEECFKVSRDNKIGLYTSSGVLILPCEFNSIQRTTLGNTEYIEVKKDGYVGLYDMDAAPVFTADKYDSYKFLEGRGFLVSNLSRYGWLDVTGNEVVPVKYIQLDYFPKEKVFYCKVDGKCGLVDMSGNELFPFVPAQSLRAEQYSDKQGNMMDYLIVYNLNGKYSAIDYAGNILATDVKKPQGLRGKVSDYLKKNPGNAAYKSASAKIESAYASAENRVAATIAKRNTFSHYAQNYVEKVINDWQRKGEYEKIDDWKKRVNEETRQQKVFKLTKEAQEQFVASRTKILPPDRLVIAGPYDPDNETYNLKSLYSQTPLTVNIAACDAEEFKSSFDKVKCKPSFIIENDFLGLSEYDFLMPNGNTYHYRHDEALNYSVANVEYNFNSIELDGIGKQGFSTSALKIGTSDVDVKIPTTNVKQDKTFAIIIANEKYENEKNVDFAYNDGVIFKDYCVKALGLPEVNVHFVPNASLNQMRQQFNWIQKTAKDFNGDAQFIVYYAGHGMPDDETRDAYLLPSDADGTDTESAYKLSKLYASLSEIPAKNVLLLMDACFSGSQRNGEVLANARGVALKPNISRPGGNLTVFSAVTDKETAYSYRDKQHGLFTYFLLKKLQEHDGSLNLGQLADYVSSEVAQYSIVVNKKSQHPTVSCAPTIGQGWRNIKLK